jgi:hypothetical protein
MRVVAVDPDARLPIGADWPLDEETRAAVAMLGGVDAETEWTKFKAHHGAAGKANTLKGWRGLFTGKWCVDAKRYASRFHGGAQAPQKPVPGVTAAVARRHDEERKRREREAVPPPPEILALTAGIGRGAP